MHWSFWVEIIQDENLLFKSLVLQKQNKRKNSLTWDYVIINFLSRHVQILHTHLSKKFNRNRNNIKCWPFGPDDQRFVLDNEHARHVVIYSVCQLRPHKQARDPCAGKQLSPQSLDNYSPGRSAHCKLNLTSERVVQQCNHLLAILCLEKK